MSDLDGSTFVVTGASAGIGRATARGLADRGARVILACRSPEKTRPLLDDLAPGVRMVVLDLADLDSVRRAAAEIAGMDLPIDGLINNAGVDGRRGVTADGFELAFGVNHIGHFVFTQGLMNSMASGGRVVTVSSNAHFRADALDLSTVRGRTKSFTGMTEYVRSKLANVLFARHLQSRHPGLLSVALHPGVVATDIWKRIPAPVRPLFTRKLLTPEEGATTSLHCATSPSLVGAGYYAHSKLREPSPLALDDALAAELWDRTEQWVS